MPDDVTDHERHRAIGSDHGVKLVAAGAGAVLGEQVAGGHVEARHHGEALGQQGVLDLAHHEASIEQVLAVGCGAQIGSTRRFTSVVTSTARTKAPRTDPSGANHGASKKSTKTSTVSAPGAVSS